MPANFICPVCGTPQDSAEAKPGQPVRCSQCQQLFTPEKAQVPPGAITESPLPRASVAAAAGETANGIQAEPKKAPLPPSPTAEPIERRSIRQASSGSTVLLWVAILGCGGLLVLGCVLGGISFIIFGTLLPLRAARQEAVAREMEKEAAVAREMEKALAEAKDRFKPEDAERMKPIAEKKAEAPKEEKKPPPLMKLPPLPPAIPIEPANLKEKKSYPLPGVVSQIAAGGGGRFLLLHFAGLNKIGLFDASAAEIVHYFPAVADTTIAAGMTKLLTYAPSTGTVTRWDLLTRKQEKALPLKTAGKLTAFCMGSASEGPLLVCTEKDFRFLEIDGLTTIALPDDDEGRPITGLANNLYWAGAPGRVFGRTALLGQPNGVSTVVLEGGRARVHYQHWGTWYVVPGPNGKHIYPGGYGVLTNELKTVPDAVYSATANANAKYLYLPAHHGPFYMHLGVDLDKGGKAADRGVSIYILGAKQPIAVLTDLDNPTYDDMAAVREVGLENCVHLIPRANLLVVLPRSRDRLSLYPVDVQKALQK
jgi:hypothetical protein